jgi:hypothetical protein
MKKQFLTFLMTSFVSISASANDIVTPEIKYSNKQFELKVPQKKVRTLAVEIRDAYDNVVYSTTYYDVNDFQKVYSIEQLPKGKYFVTVTADGKVYRDMIKVRRKSI